MRIIPLLKKAIKGDDDAVLELQKHGILESFTETSNGVYVNTMIFTKKDNNEIYTFSEFDKAYNKVNKLDDELHADNSSAEKKYFTVTLKSGASFKARSSQGALTALGIIKKEYETLLNSFQENEDYDKAAKCRDAIIEIDEKIKFYEQTKGFDSELGSIQLGEI